MLIEGSGFEKVDNSVVWSDYLTADTGISRGTQGDGFNGDFWTSTSAVYGDAIDRGYLTLDLSTFNLSGAVSVAAKPEGGTFNVTVTGDTTETFSITEDGAWTGDVVVNNIQSIRIDNPTKSSANFSLIKVDDTVLIDSVNQSQEWSTTITNDAPLASNGVWGPGAFALTMKRRQLG